MIKYRKSSKLFYYFYFSLYYYYYYYYYYYDYYYYYCRRSGKTSTLRSLTDQEFLSTASTIGIESHLREVDVGGDGVWREVLAAAGHSELAEVILQNLLRKRELEQQREQERENWNFFLSLPNPDRKTLKLNQTASN
jgi:hypothetical protein